MMSPVFVVGSPRSGTSILVTSLKRAGYNGFFENNFLTAAEFLERSVDRFFAAHYTPNPGILISQIDKEVLKHRISRVIIEAALEKQPGAPWVDKSGGPKVIAMIPLLREMLPSSRFIFAKRRAIENVVSRLVKFPKPSFEYHCTDWAETMAAWRNLKATAPGDHLLEIDQRVIADRPGEAALQIGNLLALSTDEVNSLVSSFTKFTPQQTDSGSARRVLALAATGWTEDMKQTFQNLCGAEMAAEGYSMDETYRQQTPASTDEPAGT